MRKFHIVGLRLRKEVRTTIPGPSATPVPDLFQRDFAAQVPNNTYVGDITYLPVGNGQFLYLATVLDLCSKRLTGWSIADHIRTSLVTDALRAAARARGGDGLRGAVFHSDNGAQYVSKEFAQVCSELGVTRSRGAVGASADNAAAESLNATMKRETLQGRKRWNGASEARLGIFRWATRYNTRRRHSRLGQISPITGARVRARRGDFHCSVGALPYLPVRRGGRVVRACAQRHHADIPVQFGPDQALAVLESREPVDPVDERGGVGGLRECRSGRNRGGHDGDDA